MASGKHSKSPDYSRLTPLGYNRSHTPYKQDDKWNQAQHDLMVKVGQMEKEVKARKEAEEKYKEALVKMERLQLTLQQRSEQQEEVKRGKEEAEDRCETLQMTINKLEEYLRKKSTNEYPRVGKSEADGVTKSLADVINLENRFKEMSKELERERRCKENYKERCKLLTEKLRDNGIQIDDSWKDNDVQDLAEELDF